MQLDTRQPMQSLKDRMGLRAVVDGLDRAQHESHSATRDGHMLLQPISPCWMFGYSVIKHPAYRWTARWRVGCSRSHALVATMGGSVLVDALTSKCENRHFTVY